MTWLSSLRERRSLENPTVPLTAGSLIDWIGGPVTDAGVNVNEKGSMRLAVVYRCVNLLASLGGTLPIKAYRTGTFEEQQAQLLANPHPEMTAAEFWQLTYVHRLLWGNHYSEKITDQANRIRALLPIEPWNVRVGRSSDGTKMFEVTRSDGRVIPATSAEVFHIPGLSYDGVTGLSPVRLAAQGLGLAIAAESYGARFFGSGALASGVLRTDQQLTQEQADALKQRWRDKNSGMKSAHDTIVLDSGAEFQQLTMPNSDAQFLQTRDFQTTDITRWFGVPPHMVGDVDRSTSWGTGIEQQSIGFVQYTLQPNWLVPTEQRITKELLKDPSVYAKYRIEGLLRGDSAARAAFYNVMRNIGAFSANDVRALEDMPPVDGGDSYLEPLNMAPLGASRDNPGDTPTPDGASEGNN